MEAILPAVLTGNGPTQYRVTPDERSFDGTGESTHRLHMSRNAPGTGTTGTTTHNAALCVYVFEGVYPGRSGTPSGENQVQPPITLAPDTLNVETVSSPADPELRQTSAKSAHRGVGANQRKGGANQGAGAANSTWEFIQDKWVYVLLGKTLAAEAHAVSKDKWEVGRNLDATAQPQDRNLNECTTGYVRLKFGQEYGFFLSPIRLTPEALKYLMEDRSANDSPLVTRTFDDDVNSPNQHLAIPDPFRWACDAQRLWYQPALDKYEEFVQGDKPYDEDPRLPESVKEKGRDTRLYIAKILKQWMAAKAVREEGVVIPVTAVTQPSVTQPPAAAYSVTVTDSGLTTTNRAPLIDGIQRVLSDKDDDEHHSLDLFLDSYRKTEQNLLQVAGVAMKYVEQCVLSIEHRVVELAAQDTRDASEFFEWACVTYRATETKPGCEFLKRVIAVPELLPGRCVFPDDDAEDTGLEDLYSKVPYAAVATLGIIYEFAAPWIKHKESLLPVLLDRARRLQIFLKRVQLLDGNPTETTLCSSEWVRSMNDKYSFGESATVVRASTTEVTPKAETAGGLSLVLKSDDHPDKYKSPAFLIYYGKKSGMLKSDFLHQVYKKDDYWLDLLTDRASRAVAAVNLALTVAELRDDRSPLVNGVTSGNEWEYSGREIGLEILKTALEALKEPVAKVESWLPGKPSVTEGIENAIKDIKVLAFVNGVLEINEYVEKASESFSEEEYGRGIGYGISAVGAWVELIEFIAGNAWELEFPLAFVLVAAGWAIVNFMDSDRGDTTLQAVVRRCYFGIDPKKKHGIKCLSHPEVGDGGTEEAFALNNFQANFDVDRKDLLGSGKEYEANLSVHPGFLPEGSVFEIWYRLATDLTSEGQKREASEKEPFARDDSQEARQDNTATSSQGRQLSASLDTSSPPYRVAAVAVDGKQPRLVKACTGVEVTPLNDKQATANSFTIKIKPASMDILIRLSIGGGDDVTRLTYNRDFWMPHSMNLLCVSFDSGQASSMETSKWLTPDGDPFACGEE